MVRRPKKSRDLDRVEPLGSAEDAEQDVSEHWVGPQLQHPPGTWWARSSELRIALYAILVLMTLGVTVLTYTDFGAFLFNMGSNVYMIRRLPRGVMVLATLLLMSCPAFTLRRKSPAPFVIAIIFSVALWLMCGRAVAMVWDGRVATGWLCFRTNDFDLFQKGDGEDFTKHWQVSRLSGWRLELRRSTAPTHRIFVGPLLLSESLGLFESYGVVLGSK